MSLPLPRPRKGQGCERPLSFRGALRKYVCPRIRACVKARQTRKLSPCRFLIERGAFLFSCSREPVYVALLP